MFLFITMPIQLKKVEIFTNSWNIKVCRSLIVAGIECNIRVRASIQTFENEHVWKGKNTCSIFFFFFSFVFITNLAHNIDHSQSNQTCQSNPTLRWFTIHVWLNHSWVRMHVWCVWFILWWLVSRMAHRWWVLEDYGDGSIAWLGSFSWDIDDWHAP